MLLHHRVPCSAGHFRPNTKLCPTLKTLCETEGPQFSLS